MKKNIILFVNLLSINLAFCQSIDLPKSVLTPNASSLGKYGDVPVSYYTGRPNVSIPLYSMIEHGVPLNISLDYDSGGVRVGELPSWIGQNWSLSAGGVIVRTIKGGADEILYDNTWPNYQDYAKGYIYKYSTLNTPNWTSASYLKSLAPGLAPDDFQPDIFTFNFMGFSGKFFLGQDGNWKVQSESNMKVEINMADNVLTLGRTTQCVNCWNNATPPRSIGKITLTDENGTKYIFGNNPKAIEYANNSFFSYPNTVTNATAWYLTSVNDRFGKLLYSFQYARGEYQGSFYLTDSCTAYQKDNGGGIFNPGPGACSGIIPSRHKIEGGLIAPVYLTGISTSSGKTIDFNRSQSNFKYYTSSDLNWRMQNWDTETGYGGLNGNLAEVEYLFRRDFYLLTHDSNDQNIPFGTYFSTLDRAQFLLNQTKYYKLDNITIKADDANESINLIRNTDLNERLNLMGVEINGITDVDVAPLRYSFEYNNFNALPAYLDSAIDHWGFYQGVYNNPPTNVTGWSSMDNYSSYYNMRNPNPSFMAVGSLKKIIYPTGGNTEFEFEPHTYSKYVGLDTSNNFQLIPENDIAGGLRIKKIRNFDGAKTITKEFKYTDGYNSANSSGILAFKNQYYVPLWNVTTESGVQYREKVFNINNLIPMSNFSGSHIGYSKVFEFQTGNGYKEYQYTNYADYPDVPYTVTLSQSHSVFDSKISNDFKRGRLKKEVVYNELGQILKESTNTFVSVGSYKARGFDFIFQNPCGSSDTFKVGNTYEIEYSDFVQSSHQENNYFGFSVVSTLTNNSYSAYPNDAAFFGDTFLREQTINLGSDTKSRSFNYPFDSSSAGNTSLVGSHCFPVIESIYSKNSEIISKEKVNYGTVPGNSYPVAYNSEKAKGANAYETDIIVDKYDTYGNIVQYHKSGTSFYVSLLWSANNPYLKVEGDAWDFNESTMYANPKLKVTRQYHNTRGNLLNLKYPNGIIENYTYDAFGRLILATDGDNNLIRKIDYNNLNN